MEPELTLEKLDESSQSEVIDFLETIFTKEQDIPRELIPLKHVQQWWCIRKEGSIIGTVAAWKIDGEWHWGRLAVDPKQRGLGLAKKLAAGSFQSLFDSGISEIIIDARDITVKLLSSLGGEITGPTEEFYNHPITPMIIRRHDFLKSIG